MFISKVLHVQNAKCYMCIVTFYIVIIVPMLKLGAVSDVCCVMTSFSSLLPCVAHAFSLMTYFMAH